MYVMCVTTKEQKTENFISISTTAKYAHTEPGFKLT